MEETSVVDVDHVLEEANTMVLDDVGLNVECDSENSRKKARSFTCLVCSKRFSQNSGRYNHMKKVHKIFPGQDNLNVKCLEKDCNYTCSFKEKLQLHLTEVHGVKMNLLLKTFNNSQEFLQWKDEFERQEKCRFVKKSGSRIREEGIRVGYYYCSRSGNYISHSKGMKNCKKIGTSKTNNHCTASITCLELKNGKLDVKVCSTHYGHDTDLQHLRLTQSQKYMIAEQLCQGVPRELVLDNVRASATSDVDKLHLISLKDVKNIEKSFGIQGVSNVKTDNVYHNLIFWVSNIMKTEHCPLVYFSEDGDFESLNHKDHDLTLVLITKGQIELLNKFGARGTYYISPFVAENTHYSFNAVNPIKPYSVYITVVLLVDDLNDVVPVSYMVSHKVNSNKYINLFDSIKDKVSGISAKVILTDDREEIYDAWCAVFGDHPVHLWSNRFVDSDWRLNLIQIPDEDLQETIYEQMYSFLESSDVSKLESTLENFVLKLQSDATTKKFGDYFASKYIGCEDLWAGCYGKALVGINAQLNMENVFNQIEEVVQRKNWDRNFLVRTVQHLIKYINEKQCDRHMKLQKQIQEIPTHHSLAINIKPEAVSKTKNNEWRVNSVKDPEHIFSLVSKRTSDCKSCTMFCSDCNICAHQFQCSCKVHQFDKTMCKHIHAVAVKIKPRKKIKSQKLAKKSMSKRYAAELSKQTTLWEEKGCNGKRKSARKKGTLEENEKSTIDTLEEDNANFIKKRKLSNETDKATTENQNQSLKFEIKLFHANESAKESILPDIESVEELSDNSPGLTDNTTSMNKPPSNLIIFEISSPQSNKTHKNNTSSNKPQSDVPENLPPKQVLDSKIQNDYSSDPENEPESLQPANISTSPTSDANESAKESILPDIEYVEEFSDNSPGLADNTTSMNKPPSNCIITESSSPQSNKTHKNNTSSYDPQSDVPENLPPKQVLDSKIQNDYLSDPENDTESAQPANIPTSPTSDKVPESASFETKPENLRIGNTVLRIPISIEFIEDESDSSKCVPKKFEKECSKITSEYQLTLNDSKNNPAINTSQNEPAGASSRLELLNKFAQNKPAIKSSEVKPTKKLTSSKSSSKHPKSQQLARLVNKSLRKTSENQTKSEISELKSANLNSKNKPLISYPAKLTSTTKSGNKPSGNPTETVPVNPVTENKIFTSRLQSKPTKDELEIKPASNTSETEPVSTPSISTLPLSNSPDRQPASKLSKSKSEEDPQNIKSTSTPGSKDLNYIPENKPASSSSKNQLASRPCERIEPQNHPENAPSCSTSENMSSSNSLDNKTVSVNSENQGANKRLIDPPENELLSTTFKNEPEDSSSASSAIDLIKSSADKYIDTPKKRGRPRKVISSTIEESEQKKRKLPQLSSEDEPLVEERPKISVQQ